MSRWKRIVRGMIGMGLTFSAGIGAVASVVAGVVAIFGGGGADPELFRFVAASAIWGFPIGAAFSGVVALAARGRSFDELSLPRFAATGAGAGLLLFGALALNAWDAWTLQTALVNAGIFVGFGTGAATASLLIARKAGAALESGDDPPSLGTG